MNVGTSYLLDFSGVIQPKYHDRNFLIELLETAAKIGSLTNLGSGGHQFDHSLDDNTKPGGATAFVLLSESHISAHTWPETGNLVIDVFSCGTEEQTQKVVNYLTSNITHEELKIRRIERG